MVERTAKFQTELNPRSGAAVWLVAPVDEHGHQECADLHVSFDRAEEAAYALLQAVDDARTQLDSEGE